MTLREILYNALRKTQMHVEWAVTYRGRQNHRKITLPRQWNSTSVHSSIVAAAEIYATEAAGSNKHPSSPEYITAVRANAPNRKRKGITTIKSKHETIISNKPNYVTQNLNLNMPHVLHKVLILNEAEIVTARPYRK